ncbi:MAG: Flp family type IVb pilin, partial [Planctomyces sp.]
MMVSSMLTSSAGCRSELCDIPGGTRCSAACHAKMSCCVLRAQTFCALRYPLVVPCSGSVAMSKFISAVRRLLVREEGATMVEYGLMVALIAIVAVAAVGTLGGRVSD